MLPLEEESDACCAVLLDRLFDLRIEVHTQLPLRNASPIMTPNHAVS
jgi:hypothetical protein